MSNSMQFRDAIQSAGLKPPEYIEPGKLHRFPGIGKTNGNTAGWAKLFEDGQGGVYGDWSQDISETWQAKRDKPMSQAEYAAFQQRCDQERKERDAEQKRQQDEAAAKAAELWSAAKPEIGSHKYLLTKHIKAHGIRTNGNQLIIPMRSNGKIRSLQFIGPDGDKKFLFGGQVKGCYFAIGKPDGVLCVCEGFSTGASIHEATGYAVAVAFNAGNLEPVAKAMRAKFPDIRIILCADDDRNKDKNAGLTKATQAAQAVNGLLAVPAFKDRDGTDFNDLAKREGLEAVKRDIDAAKTAASTIPVDIDNNPPIRYRRVSEIQAQPIKWLWKGRIARGKVSILAGNPGLGKSQITASMAAIVSTGGIWPVDRTRCERGTVVILSAEDDPADTIRPRLEAAEADISKIFTLDAVVDGFRADGAEIHRTFNLQTDLNHLGAILDRIGDVAMVVIDPITAYLGKADSHKNSDIRALLAPLSDLAAKYDAAVVCVSHLNKSGGNDALTRIMGSMAFVAAARAAFIVLKDQDDEARRLLLPIKNNIGNDKTGFAFTVQAANIDSSAGIIESSRIMWESEAVTVTAEEAMTLSDPEERSATDEAKDWLTDFLRHGAVKASEVQKEAKQAGISDKSLRRAREQLGIKPKKETFAGGWRWSLPSESPESAPPKMPQDAQDAQDFPSRNEGIFGLEGHLRQDSEDDPDQETVTI